MKVLRLFLIPFSLLYGSILSIRHFLYDKGWLKSTYFGKKVVVIGNLIVGGAGKSPMVEYLIERLSKDKRIAVLSRGYGRETRGYLTVEVDNDSRTVGDEPLQIKRKFPSVMVADCEDRVWGIQQLKEDHDVILLDDAFQHRALKPGISVLLFDYPRLFAPKHLLPAGDYRDLFSRRHAADLIVVTKCPDTLQKEEMQRARLALKLKKDTPVFFSYIQYGELIGFQQMLPIPPSTKQLIAVSGIANPAPFLTYLERKYEIISSFVFPDHHAYTAKEVGDIRKKWEENGENAIIVTTEKDLMRLQQPMLADLIKGLPLFYLPIKHGFFKGDEDHFEQCIKALLR